LVDLSAFYNLEFGEELSCRLTGIMTFDHTQFDARGCLFLTSGKFYPNRVPDQMLGIPVGQKGRRIRFLQGAFFGNFDAPDTLIGKYILHFADETVLERDLFLGRDVRNTWADPPPTGDPHFAVACILPDPKTNPEDEPHRASTRLYVMTCDNPHPDKEIVSLDFVSFRQLAAPFLVAVTVE
jgi:hypothetical protein